MKRVQQGELSGGCSSHVIMRRGYCGDQLEDQVATLKAVVIRPCQWHAAVDEVAQYVGIDHSLIRYNTMRQSEARAGGGY